MVILKENNQKIGAVGVFERTGLEVLDIGFSFLGPFEGYGYAYESASKLSNTVRQNLVSPNFRPLQLKTIFLPRN